jgi:hypothetical protein
MAFGLSRARGISSKAGDERRRNATNCPQNRKYIPEVPASRYPLARLPQRLPGCGCIAPSRSAAAVRPAGAAVAINCQKCRRSCTIAICTVAAGATSLQLPQICRHTPHLWMLRKYNITSFLLICRVHHRRRQWADQVTSVKPAQILPFIHLSKATSVCHLGQICGRRKTSQQPANYW